MCYMLRHCLKYPTSRVSKFESPQTSIATNSDGACITSVVTKKDMSYATTRVAALEKDRKMVCSYSRIAFGVRHTPSVLLHPQPGSHGPLRRPTRDRC